MLIMYLKISEMAKWYKASVFDTEDVGSIPAFGRK